ncbi:cation efflux protein [Calocera viscosa TUFC12733]|uniref:Cation efflux protein n=1 Tax=Calocera viscosa (strain TUFC12733) TaxID=1330018 RepID=A0A167M164_CALVF|nr:cation efflux protein [Calocera viscosa TUFC12733]
MQFSRGARIITLLVIDTIFFFIELIIGYAIGSLALVADSFHMLNDIISLVVALYAIKLMKNKASNKYSYGWHRAEVLAALVNGVFLLALCFSIFLEAIERFFSQPEITNPKLVVIVGCLGLLSNFVGLFLFNEHGHSHGAEQGHDDHDHEHEEHEHAHEHVPKPTERSPLIRYEGLPQATPVRHRTSSMSSTIYAHPAIAQRAAVMEEAEEIERAKSPERRENYISPALASRRQSLMSPSAASVGTQKRHDTVHEGEEGEESTAGEEEDITAEPVIIETVPTLAKTNGGSHPHDHAHPHKADHEHAHAHDHPHDHPHKHGDGHSHRHSHDGEPEFDIERGAHDHSAFHKEKKKGGHGHSHGNMNMRALLLHVMGDALGNIGVIAAGLIIWLTDIPHKFFADPIISLIITCIIFSSAMPLCRSASIILLQAVPQDIDLDDVRDAVLKVPGVLAIHELHVWQLSETRVVASVHVWVSKAKQYMNVASKIRKVFHDHGIHSCTIQPEFHPEIEAPDEGQIRTDEDTSCLIACDGEMCDENLCCPPIAPISITPPTAAATGEEALTGQEPPE